jgi:Flp pilus assembly protein CpaB
MHGADKESATSVPAGWLEAAGRNIMLTVRALCLAISMLVLASCGSEPDRILATLNIPPGMRAVSILVQQDISIAPGDHVDVLIIGKEERRIVLQNVEVVTRDENVVQFIVTLEDARLIMQAGERGQFKLRQNY